MATAIAEQELDQLALPPDQQNPFEVLEAVINLERISVTEFLARTGVASQTYYNWRNGVSKPRRTILAGVAATLGVPVELFALSRLDALRWLLSHNSAQYECFV